MSASILPLRGARSQFERLVALRTRLLIAKSLAAEVRRDAMSSTASDEPYRRAIRISTCISASLQEVEDALADLGVNPSKGGGL